MSIKKKDHQIIILGTGNFGTCLAQHLARIGNRVIMWGRSEHVTSEINQSRKNPRYLSEFVLHENISATHELTEEHFVSSDAIVIAIPTQNIRVVLRAFKDKIAHDKLIVCTAKGIEISTHTFPSTIIRDALGRTNGERIAILSGPSFAIEVIKSMPTCVSIASTNPNDALEAQHLFHAPTFRSYTSTDPIGLEVAGALKNVIAIAAGACDGLGHQSNAKAALITRGLAEITRIGNTLGANPLTFTGLGGVGDLFLTCTSQKSRNFQVGYHLGQGLSLEKILSTMSSVAEGIATAEAAKILTSELDIDAPITNEVYEVIYQDKPIAEAVRTLLEREPKPEISH